ncbi:MAG: FAD-dependent oxidoreductase [Solirubrobacteraceae bacterium]
MTEQHNNPGAAAVVIAGGGVAGLEALLALRALAGDRVNLTLVAPQDSFVDRPMTVAQPFGLGSAARYPLAEIATEAGAEFVRGRVVGVDDGAHQVRMASGPDLEFDTLILAPGTRQSSPSPNAIAFGLEGSDQAIAEMLERLRSGQANVVTFAAPSTTGWLLPLYELALMTARELARSHVDGVRLRLVSPEARPLALFGDEASASVAGLLAAAGIEYVPTHYTSAQGGGIAVQSPDTDYVVTLPTLQGPELAGVPSTQPHGFIPVDEFGRVRGLSDVYAAGDAIDFAVKQGGLAAQQADSVAEHIAASHGASVEPTPFAPVLRGMLFTGGEPLYMRSAVPGADPEVPGAWYPLWWPPTKVAGRYLAPYLFARGEDDGLGGPPIGFIDVDIPLSAVTLPG